MTEKEQKAVCLLMEKYRCLGRYPTKDDYTDVQVSYIKATLGPWPRALEKAGIKPAVEKKKSHPHSRKSRNINR